jgi:hypothetical protein
VTREQRIVAGADGKTGSQANDTARFWPPLAYPQWRDTATTFQRWTQIVGKVRLALSPWLNHGWQVPLYVNARGLGTSPIHAGRHIFEIDFDLVDHRLKISTPDAADRVIDLEPMSVAVFYRRFMAELAGAGVDVTIGLLPNEIPDPIRFPTTRCMAPMTQQRSTRSGAAHSGRPCVSPVPHRVLGKASPVHFFWGSFDLAVTRFSGRMAPPHPGGVPGLPDAVTREAYSHEVSSAGFWPGNDKYPEAAFYSYAYPAPKGFGQASVEPVGARWSAEMGEWLLAYEAVRTAADPESALLSFLETTYRAAADLATWDRALECAIGAPSRPRPVQPPEASATKSSA